MTYYTPPDYSSPEWSKRTRVHDWRNYISEEVREMWHTFTDEQKAALARQANIEASMENWE